MVAVAEVVVVNVCKPVVVTEVGGAEVVVTDVADVVVAEVVAGVVAVVVEVVVVPDLHPEMMREISKIQIRTPKTAFLIYYPLHYFVDKSRIALVAPGL